MAVPEYDEYRPKKIVNVHKHVDGPWFWGKYTAHPYVGCRFGCELCYTRGGRYMGRRDPDRRVVGRGNMISRSMMVMTSFVTILVLAACAGPQQPGPEVASPEPEAPAPVDESFLEMLARAYFVARRAPADLEGVSRLGDAPISTDRAAEMIELAEGVALSIAGAAEPAARLGLEDQSVEIRDASEALREAAGEARAGDGRALALLLDELNDAPESLYEALLSASAEQAAEEGSSAQIAQCLLARIEAYEIWCAHLAQVDENAMALARQERSLRPVLGEMADLMEVRRQLRLIEEHRVLARRALTALAEEVGSLGEISRELEWITLVEGFSSTLDRADETTRSARDQCRSVGLDAPVPVVPLDG